MPPGYTPLSPTSPRPGLHVTKIGQPSLALFTKTFTITVTFHQNHLTGIILLEFTLQIQGRQNCNIKWQKSKGRSHKFFCVHPICTMVLTYGLKMQIQLPYYIISLISVFLHLNHLCWKMNCHQISFSGSCFCSLCLINRSSMSLITIICVRRWIFILPCFVHCLLYL